MEPGTQSQTQELLSDAKLTIHRSDAPLENGATDIMGPIRSFSARPPFF
jgi:hypothetical protein